MKVYIATDLEGISGVTVWEQTRDRTTQLYQQARCLLTREVNAAVQGCLHGGATEVIVLDGHGGGFNFVPEEMHTGATWVTGPGRPDAHCGLDATCHAAIFVGYHAMAGTPNAVLCHTQSSLGGNRYWYNGRESGEIAQSAICCGHHGVPVVMVAGDEAACREAREFLGHGIVTVSVKKGLGITCCEMIAPSRAWPMVREAAAEALARVGQVKPYQIAVPIQARIQFGSKEIADKAGCTLSKRVDDTMFERTMESPLEIYRF